MHQNLNSLSIAISVAQNALEEADAAAASARAPRDQIAGRLQQMTQERATIATRRAGGEHHPEDAGRLALLDMDSAALALLQHDAEAACVDATAKYTEARAALASAQAQYVAEEGRMALSALDDHADKLLKLLFQTMAQRKVAAAGRALEDRATQRMVNRLISLDALMCGELREVRALPMRGVPTRARPIWTPSDLLHDDVWRLHHGEGLFV